MKFSTTRFGEVDAPEEKIITFSEGVIGFSHLKKFVVIRHRQSEFMYWLQSLDMPDLAFLMMFPFSLLADYNPELSVDDMDRLRLSKETLKKAEVYCITVVPKNPQDMRVNLLSPIVINPDEKIGRQVILEKSRYTVDFKIIQEIKKKLEEDSEKEKDAHPEEKAE